MPDQPNVLMVLADQHNASWLGCAGHPQVLTPHLDAFADTGVRFTQAYTQNTICTPSRVSVLSGQYCHNHGYYGLSGPASFGLGNFMRHFRQHGYRTAAYGKLHLPESPRNWLADDLDEFGDTYETADGVFGRSAYLGELECLGLRELEDSWHNHSGVYGPQTIQMDAMVSRLPYEHTQEVWCARRAMQFMDQSLDQPFCVQVALQRPHHPLLPQPCYWDQYPDDLELPPTHDQPPTHRPPHFQAAWEAHHKGRWEYAVEGEPLEQGFRRHWRGTLACVSQMDDVFGMLLSYLDEHGLSDNTIVIYSSDHGAYHGVHGVREKAPGICSDAVCHIPLLWRVPGVSAAGTTHAALVEAVDFAPTLAALCGLPEMECVDGLDVGPLLRGETTAVREVAVTENPWSKSLRWERWRFVHYQREMFDGQDQGELYDLEADPDETHNLYHDSEAQGVVSECRRRLLEWLIATTRVRTVHPTSIETGSWLEVGRCTYPLGSDGTAPNRIQPRFVTSRHTGYL